MEIDKDHPMIRILSDVGEERQKQIEKWGQQTHIFEANWTSKGIATPETFRNRFELEQNKTGGPCWETILLEEVSEALYEPDVAKLREELIQVAAVCAAWVEDIDRRKK
jgi:hypothetical protein